MCRLELPGGSATGGGRSARLASPEVVAVEGFRDAGVARQEIQKLALVALGQREMVWAWSTLGHGLFLFLFCFVFPARGVGLSAGGPWRVFGPRAPKLAHVAEFLCFSFLFLFPFLFNSKFEFEFKFKSGFDQVFKQGHPIHVFGVV